MVSILILAIEKEGDSTLSGDEAENLVSAGILSSLPCSLYIFSCWGKKNKKIKILLFIYLWLKSKPVACVLRDFENEVISRI